MNNNTVACGDLHVGKKHKVTYGDPTIWNDLPLKVLSNLIKTEKPTLLILDGDVFDSSRPTALDFARLVSVVAVVDEVYILTGNHDLSMLVEEIAFQHLNNIPNITIIQANEYDYMPDGSIGVGWCDTQEKFEHIMAMAISSAPMGGTIHAHCNRKYWENDNDNSFTDALYEMARDKEIIVYSGHEHTASVSKHFVHLGSVVPQASNQVGDKYYLHNGELKRLPNHASIYEEDQADLYFLKDEPLNIRDNACYMVRVEKEIKPEDLKLEGKDLTIDIIESFKEAALKEGFSKELLNEYI